jgi:predicted permease
VSQSERSPGGAPAPAPAPRLPLLLLRAWLPFAERDEVLAELTEEHAQREAREGRRAARAWLWRQVLGSVPPLVRRTFTRGWSGFEPASSRLRPGGPPMESFIMDVRYAARRLRSRPTYALVTILTLALGIGGTAAAFGLVRGLLMAPLPYAGEDRLVQFWSAGNWSESEYLHLDPDWGGFSHVAAYRSDELPLQRAPDAAPQLVPAVGTTATLFDTLGVKPLLGRTFEPGEDRPGAAPAVVIAHGLYQELGGDPALVGSQVLLDGKPHSVVGVMPQGFWFPDARVKAWVALELNAEDGSGNYALVARRGPGTDGAAVSGSLGGLARRLGEFRKYPPDFDKTRDAAVTPLREALLGGLEAPLLATLGAMAVLLLIACANVAALMLGQVDARSTEMAVRAALGADARRMAQQLVAEALLLGVAAAGLGALLAAQGFRLLADALPLGPLAPRAELSWGVFTVAFLLALGAALLVALLPALAMRRTDPQRALSSAKSGGVGARGGRVEGALVVGQVALAVLLAAGAGLLVRSVTKLRAIDPGVETDEVAVVDVVMPRTMDRGARVRVLTELEPALAALPGVRAAGATQTLPLRGRSNDWGVRIDGRPDLGVTTTYVRVVTPGYFEAVGMKLVEGRLPDARDREDTERVVVVNRAMARKYWGSESPLNRTIRTGWKQPERVVGVVEDVAEASLSMGGVPARYMLYTQVPDMPLPVAALTVRARPGVDPAALLEQVRGELQRAAPGLAVQRTTTLSAVLTEAVGPVRQVMTVLTLLTGLALVLGAVGIYGVTSHFVTRRRRDLGIRIALGLQPSRVVTQVVGRGSAMVGVGAAVGIGAALLLARLLSSLLYGVSAVDPLSLLGASAALLLVGVLAALLPALRASRLDPAAVFREQ